MMLESCPKCKFELSDMVQECPSCGIVFSKLSDRNSSPDKQIMGNSELLEQWKDIVSNYEDGEAHEHFVQKALGYKKLNFASQQYRKMLELNPNDEMAKSMQNKIIQIATLQIASEKQNRNFTRPPKWTSAMIAIASAVFFVGFFTDNPYLLLGGVVGFVGSFVVRYYKSHSRA